jgi:hypothetical protein
MFRKQFTDGHDPSARAHAIVDTVREPLVVLVRIGRRCVGYSKASLLNARKAFYEIDGCRRPYQRFTGKVAFRLRQRRADRIAYSRLKSIFVFGIPGPVRNQTK